jgi:tetratricopeptide (TPR) repeat protein
MAYLSMTALRIALNSRLVLVALAMGGLYSLSVSAQEPNAHQVDRAASFEALQRQVEADADAGKSAEAVHDLIQALEIRPDWQEGWWNLGTLQYEASHYQEATQAFRRVVEFKSQMGTAWALLGLCEFELKDYGNALSHLEKAQSLGFGDDPEITRVSSYHLALLLIRQGDFERGSELLKSAFAEASLSSQVKLALGLAVLRVPLLPDELDPSKDALVRTAGELLGPEGLTLFPQFIRSNPTAPYVRYAFGVRLEGAGRFNEALVQQRDEARVSPKSALPWIRISALQLELQNRSQAVTAAENAVALDPAGASTHLALAAALESLGKNERATQERDRARSLEAEKLRDPLMISLYGTSAESTNSKDQAANTGRWNQAMLDYSAERYGNAIAELKPWLKENPAHGTGWAVLGLSEFAQKDYENARIHLERGEQYGMSGSAQSVRQAKYTLGVLLVAAGEFEHASEVLTSAAGPGDLQPEVRLASGLVLLRISRLPGDLDPVQRELAGHAGEIAEFLHASNYDQADAQFEMLLKQYPTTPFLHYAYGTALLALSQYEEAAAQMRSEIVISPNSELPFVRLASIALRQKLPAEAIVPAEHAVQLAGRSAEAHYLLGNAALQLGDVARAVHELEIASALAPGSPETHFNLAKAYAKSGQPQKAAQERATFSSLNALAEQQRSQSGDQAYRGPREAGEISATPKQAGNPPN